MKHWAISYLGLPFKNGESDCYGLVRRVYKERLNIELPIIDVNSLNTVSVIKCIGGYDRSEWVNVASPNEFDVIQMGHANRPHHVGIWINVDCGKILHSTEQYGAIIQSVQQAKSNGWKVLDIYRHKRCELQ
jgi:hypothetical protein